MRRKNEAGKDKKRELFSYLVNISHLCSGIRPSLWSMASDSPTLGRHSGPSFRENGALSPKHKEVSLSHGRLRVCARNDGQTWGGPKNNN